jgi:hypothetical protein
MRFYQHRPDRRGEVASGAAEPVCTENLNASVVVMKVPLMSFDK